jgi:Uma2 family endonuclease
MQRKPRIEQFSGGAINKNGCLIVIPRWMADKYNFDEPPNLVIECKSEGILIKRLDVFP